jgi:two-component system, OmpR family, sensor histidine kinase TctE
LQLFAAWATALKKLPDKSQNSGLAFGLFQREQRSLFGEILDWMLTPLLLLWPLSLALTWWVAQGIAAKPYDRALEYNLRAMAQLVHFDNQRVDFALTQETRDLMRSDETDLVYYQVLGAKGFACG